MRRDYVEPDDFEYEPTAHDEVLATAQGAQGQVAAGEGTTSSTWTDLKNVTAQPQDRRRLEGWNRPPVIETEGDGELLEVWPWARIILRRMACSAWMWRWMASG